jgi:hypothetical protein
MHRPPSLPTYRGRVLRVPQGGGRYPSHGAPQAPERRPQAPQQSQQSPQAPRPAPEPRKSPTSRGQSSFRPPERDQKGRAIDARPISDTTKNGDFVHKTVANPGFTRSVQSLTQAETDRDGKFHWYKSSGVQFAHWYDRDNDRHWFGFYQGRDYLWTISYHNNFWWHEPASGRWLVFWHDHWWWHSPQGGYYVFIDGQYYQWTPGPNGVLLVQAPAVPAAGEPKPEVGGETLVVSGRPEFNYSADGSRMVQVEGEELSAYLYDLTKKDLNGGNLMVRFLGEGVTSVAFSDPSRGPLQIIMSIQNADGSIRQVVLDADGNPMGNAPPGAINAPVVYGTPGTPGFDAPGGDLPPTDSPMPDGN